MRTECKQARFEFHGLFQRKVKARFDGGKITSDAGVLLLREVEQRTGLVAGLTACFRDHRDPRLIEHTVEELLGQRIYGLCLGYEDLNDHDQLRTDPMLAVAVNKADPLGERRRQASDRGKALAGRCTLNRLELTGAEVDEQERYKKIAMDPDRIDGWMVDAFVESHESAPEEIVLDLDATDDPIHGQQEGRFFHGYYRHYCYLPLYIFSGEHLLCARLRCSNIDGAAGSAEELERIVGRIRQSWPEVSIVIRADSGFCRDELSTEQWEVMPDIEQADSATGTSERRVVGKAEFLEKGANPRFIVTSLSPERLGARALYEDFYCARGDMENRIKEQQLDLFADRTSAATMRANQLRLYLSSAAYMLMHALRRLGLKQTPLARAQCQTIRLKLLKIGARPTVRHVWISMSEAYPYSEVFAAVVRNLQDFALLRSVPIKRPKNEIVPSGELCLNPFRHPLPSPKNGPSTPPHPTWTGSIAKRKPFCQNHLHFQIGDLCGLGVHSNLIPRRIYYGAVRAQKRYFALKLPVAGGDKTVTFAYVDPGRDSTVEINTWGAAHGPLWDAIRAKGRRVEVIAIGAELDAVLRADQVLQLWAAAEPGKVIEGLTVKQEISAIREALHSDDEEFMSQYGGFNQAAERYKELLTLPEAELAKGVSIDGYSTYRAHRFAGPV